MLESIRRAWQMDSYIGRLLALCALEAARAVAATAERPLALASFGAVRMLAVGAAAWATSWLHVSPLHRYRRAVLVGAP